jgi:IS1 family transposase
MVSMKKLSTADRVQMISALVEGCSIRSTVRMTGIAKNTIVKLLADLGTVCADYHDQHVRGIKAKRIQCDEIWSFVGKKQRNVKKEELGTFGVGDCWTWTALDSDSKLMVSYMVGWRDAEYAHAFMNDVADRLATRVQLTTDGLRAYLDAVEDVFVGDVDYAQLVKIYGQEPGIPAGRYSPGYVKGCETHIISGAPERKHVSTSHVERQNLTIRMSMRRFTRLTNGFSKKVENHAHAIAIHYMHYNYCRIHQTLRVTPAMQAGLTDHVWEIEELVGLLEADEAKAIQNGAMKRGSYQKKNSD